MIDRLKRKKRRGGFTLIEVVAAFALLAIVASVLVGVFLATNQTIITSEEYDQANSAVVEYIRDVNARDNKLITVTYEDADLELNFQGLQIKVKGKIVVVAYRGNVAVEYRIFEESA